MVVAKVVDGSIPTASQLILLSVQGGWPGTRLLASAASKASPCLGPLHINMPLRQSRTGGSSQRKPGSDYLSNFLFIKITKTALGDLRPFAEWLATLSSGRPGFSLRSPDGIACSDLALRLNSWAWNCPCVTRWNCPRGAVVLMSESQCPYFNVPLKRAKDCNIPTLETE